MLPDNEMEGMGFKKVWMPKQKIHAWIADMDSIKLDYTKYDDIDLLNMFLKHYEHKENYDECIVIRDRIEEINNGDNTT